MNHVILLDKLEHYGIRGKALDLFKSYLKDRKQFTLIGENKSKISGIDCGVPQGSVLGPLFISYYMTAHVLK